MDWKGRIRAVARALRGTGLNRRIAFPDCIRVQSPDETLRVASHLIRTARRGAYLRFGDGEVNLLDGSGPAAAQRSTPLLAEEIREAFALGGPGIMKSLMIHSPRFGIFPGMVPGIHGVTDAWAEKLLSRCYPYFIGQCIYSHAALAYLSAFEPRRAIEFLTLLKAHTPVLVGNENIPPHIVSSLFGDTIHVKVPAQDAYRDIDRILQETLERATSPGGDWRAVVVAAGAAGKVLQKRLYRRRVSVFSFDFGSLMDAFCGWRTRAWMELAPYDVRELLDDL